jgi:hypothetical protein
MMKRRAIIPSLSTSKQTRMTDGVIMYLVIVSRRGKEKRCLGGDRGRGKGLILPASCEREENSSRYYCFSLMMRDRDVE